MKQLYLYIAAICFCISPAGLQAQAQKATFLNKGNLFVKDSLYINGDFQAVESSNVFQEGRTVLTGNFINEVTSGHVFTTDQGKNKGCFEFRGENMQMIMGTATKEHYINFPDTLRINNQSTTASDSIVLMQPQIAATTKVVDIQRGRLILDSQTPTGQTSITAHLLVEDKVINRVNGIQVNLALGDNHLNKRLVGFTPPFEKLYADYFFFNFLSRPTAKGLFGNDGRLISNPRTLLKPGLGYIVGMGIIPAGDPYYTEVLDPRWADADFSKRATTQFSFSRAVAEPTFSKYLNEQNAQGCVTGEKLVTNDVTVALEAGFNYLGNPYMAPLDLSDILDAQTAAAWGVGNGVLKDGFYLLSNGTGSYANGKFTFNASYLKAQNVGNTASTKFVAPMQMFIVGTEQTGVTLKIPQSKRKHDTTATFLRSAKEEVIDELLIETTDQETGGFDRLCLVFRNTASLRSDDPYDAVKIFNRSGGVNQIYTRSSDEKDMTVSVLSPTTRELSLYFEPALLPQQVTLKADRLNSLASVSYVTLEDTKTGALTDLLRTPSYTFTSSPSDKPDRFVLHFTSNPSTAAESVNAPAPYAIYEGGLLQVYGLQDSDSNSEVSIFNTQGQLVHRQPLTSTSPLQIQKYLEKGLYMLRHKATVIKFAVKN
ncbi:MAG: hypothetical protein LBQ65_01715 [Tannerellaceae bacterium]|jgi:hypothetical protein|nr:hypothetical protein [Tannerellaceae bacterium]